jgi:hypothetical protein
MYSRGSLGKRNGEAALEESSEMLLTRLWLGSCDIHSRTQQATGAYGGHSSAGFPLPCTFGCIQMRSSSLE